MSPVVIDFAVCVRGSDEQFCPSLCSEDADAPLRWYQGSHCEEPQGHGECPLGKVLDNPEGRGCPSALAAPRGWFVLRTGWAAVSLQVMAKAKGVFPGQTMGRSGGGMAGSSFMILSCRWWKIALVLRSELVLCWWGLYLITWCVPCGTCRLSRQLYLVLLLSPWLFTSDKGQAEEDEDPDTRELGFNLGLSVVTNRVKTLCGSASFKT